MASIGSAASTAPTGDSRGEAEALLASAPAEARKPVGLLARMCRVAVGTYPPDWGPELAGIVSVGCGCCPPFEACPPEPGAAPLRLPAQQIYPLRHHHEGSFTAAARSEIAATFMGCEPGAANGGGTVVFARQDDALLRVVYRTAVNPDGCEPLPTGTGRAVLICHSTSGQGGSGSTRIVRHDLTREVDEPDAVEEIDVLPLDGVCLMEVNMPYAHTALKKLAVRDLDGDGRADVVADVEHRGGVVRPQDLAACAGGDDPPMLPPTLPPARAIRFEYRFDGNRFAPTATTAARRRELYRRRDAFYSRASGSP